MTAMEKLLNLKEVSRILSINTEVLRRWLRSGKLQGVKVGSDWRVNAADLAPFLNPVAKKETGKNQEPPKKMCFRFPKWVEFSGLPVLLNGKYGPEAWPVLKKLIELDFELGKPENRQFSVLFSELAERSGYEEGKVEEVIKILQQADYIRAKRINTVLEVEIVTPMKTPKLILDISYEHGGVKGAPSMALTNSCLRRFLESGS